ncbi:hypothetical protein D3C72_789180 [compost metagenome]
MPGGLVGGLAAQPRGLGISAALERHERLIGQVVAQLGHVADGVAERRLALQGLARGLELAAQDLGVGQVVQGRVEAHAIAERLVEGDRLAKGHEAFPAATGADVQVAEEPQRRALLDRVLALDGQRQRALGAREGLVRLALEELDARGGEQAARGLAPGAHAQTRFDAARRGVERRTELPLDLQHLGERDEDSAQGLVVTELGRERHRVGEGRAGARPVAHDAAHVAQRVQEPELEHAPAIASAGLNLPEPGAQELLGVGVGVQLGRAKPGLKRVGHGLVRLAGDEGVPREGRDELHGRFRERGAGELLFEGRDRGGVHGEPGLRLHQAVEEGLVRRLVEPVGAALAGREHLGGLELVEGVEERLVGKPRDAPQDRELEDLPEHRAGFRRRHGLERERDELVGQQPLQAARHVGRRERHVGLPAPARWPQPAGLDQVVEQPLHEEGVALGEGRHLLDEARGRLGAAEHRADHAREVLGAQRRDREPLGRRKPGGARMGLARADQHEDWRVAQVAQQVIQQLNRERLGPLPVLERHDVALAPGEGEHGVGDGGLQSQLLLAGLHLGRGGRVELGQQLHQHRAEAREHVRDVLAHGRQQALENPDEVAVGEVARFVGLAHDERHVGELGLKPQLLDKPRLAEALGAPDHHGRDRLARRHRAQPGGEDGQLALTADQGRRQERAADAGGRDVPEGLEHLVGGLVPIEGLLGEQAHDHALEVGRDARFHARRRLRRLADMGAEHLHGGGAHEGRAAGEHLVSERAEAVEVRAGVDGAALDDLGAEVGHRAHDRPARAAGVLHEPEVHQLDRAVRLDAHVGGLEVAVDEALLVHVA